MNNLPPVTKNLLIINVLLFMATVVGERYGIDLTNSLGLHFFMASDFALWQPFTYMFMHSGFTHLFFNMFAVWMFGRTMEYTWGSRRFMIFYLVCGLGAALTQEAVQYIEYATQLSHYSQVNLGYEVVPMAEYLNMLNTVGASGAVFGILLGFGMTYPNERLFVFPLPMPIKAKFFVIGYAVIELLSGLNDGDNVAHFAHLGGMVFGFFLILYWKRRINRFRNHGYYS